MCHVGFRGYKRPCDEKKHIKEPAMSQAFKV